mgnify:CR=1 FL=1
MLVLKIVMLFAVFGTISTIGVKISNKKADSDHPYGHERIECVFKKNKKSIKHIWNKNNVYIWTNTRCIFRNI